MILALQNKAIVSGFMSFDMEVLKTSKSLDKEVPNMSDFEILSTVIGILGLLIALYAAMKGRKK